MTLETYPDGSVSQDETHMCSDTDEKPQSRERAATEGAFPLDFPSGPLRGSDKEFSQESLNPNPDGTPQGPCQDGHEPSGPVAPDGGYGWVICIASFLIMILLDGIMFSFGVFFLDLLEYFREGKGKTALVGSTLMGTHLIVGK